MDGITKEVAFELDLARIKGLRKLRTKERRSRGEYMTPSEKDEDICDVETKEWRGQGAGQVVRDFICPAATWHPDFFFPGERTENEMAM